MKFNLIYCHILLIFLTLMQSCNQKKDLKYANLVFDQSKQLTVKKGFTFQTEYNGIIQNERVLNYFYRSDTIYKIDIFANKILESIPLEKKIFYLQLPRFVISKTPGIGYITYTSYIEGAKGENVILKIDLTNGKTIEKKVFEHQILTGKDKSDDEKNSLAYFFSLTSFFVLNDRIVMDLGKYCSFASDDYLNLPHGADIDFEKDTINFHYIPDPMAGKGVLYPMVNSTYFINKSHKKNNIIYGFRYSPVVYLYDINTNEYIKYETRYSQIDTVIPTPKENFKSFVSSEKFYKNYQPVYDELYYDSIKNFYYRVFKLAVNDTNNVYEINFGRYGIAVYDTNFVKIAEGLIPSEYKKWIVQINDRFYLIRNDENGELYTLDNFDILFSKKNTEKQSLLKNKIKYNSWTQYLDELGLKGEQKLVVIPQSFCIGCVAKILSEELSFANEHGYKLLSFISEDELDKFQPLSLIKNNIITIVDTHKHKRYIKKFNDAHLIVIKDGELIVKEQLGLEQVDKIRYKILEIDKFMDRK